ncbi:MAG: lysophospholipid acyltransferase family protein [Actinomycetota bacterium]
MGRRKAGAAFHFAVVLLRPLLMAAMRRDWRGAEHLPAEGGFVVVSNHLSHIDPFTLAHFLWDHGYPVRYLAKEAVFRIPVAGAIVRGAGQIPVYRESGDATRAFSAAVAAVRAGECVGIYPDATLTRDPDLWPMVGKTGAARVALTTGCPVIPVAQWGPQDILAPYATRPHLLPRRTVHVWAGPPVDLSPWQGQPLSPPVLREATDAITARLVAMLETMRGEKAPAARWDPRTHDLPRTGNPRRRRP